MARFVARQSNRAWSLAALRPDKRSQDWLGNVRASLLAWWGRGFTGKCANADGHLGHCPRVDGDRVRTERSPVGRTHCRYTGPYYLGMVVPVLTVGAGIVPLSLYGWFALGAFILGGG